MAGRRTRSGFAKFEGKEVTGVSVAISNTGDGLSDAMTVDNVELHHGDVVYVVLECTVNKVRFDPIKDSKALTRVHMIRAGDATIIDEGFVREALDAQVTRIEESRGVHRLEFGEEGEEGEGSEGEPDGEGD